MSGLLAHFKHPMMVFKKGEYICSLYKNISSLKALSRIFLKILYNYFSYSHYLWLFCSLSAFASAEILPYGSTTAVILFLDVLAIFFMPQDFGWVSPLCLKPAPRNVS